MGPLRAGMHEGMHYAIADVKRSAVELLAKASSLNTQRGRWSN
jgi:hypothetical protein